MLRRPARVISKCRRSSNANTHGHRFPEHHQRPGVAARAALQRGGVGDRSAPLRRGGEPAHQRLSPLFAGTRHGGARGQWTSALRAARIRARWPASRLAVKDVILTRGRPHDVRVAAAREFRRAVRCDGDRAHRSGGRGDSRQDELRRVRHGVVERELGVRAGAQSRRARSRAGRIERRIGGGGGAGDGGSVAWDRTRAARCGSRRRSAAWWA